MSDIRSTKEALRRQLTIAKDKLASLKADVHDLEVQAADLERGLATLSDEPDGTLLFSVEDLKEVLKDLGYGERNTIAERVCKSLTPRNPGFTEAEFIRAYDELHAGGSGAYILGKVMPQVRKNRLSDSHAS